MGRRCAQGSGPRVFGQNPRSGSLSGCLIGFNSGNHLRNRRAIKQRRASDIARLEFPEFFVVPVAHQLSAGMGVVQADSVTDLMSEGVAKVVNV